MIEITTVTLKAYHSQPEVKQETFPLVYALTGKLHGGRSDGEEVQIALPALKQHRSKYPIAVEKSEKNE